MEYVVVSKEFKEGLIGVEGVYAHINKDLFYQLQGLVSPDEARWECLSMQDSDGDSIPDLCERGTSDRCDAAGEYKEIDCTGRHKTYFKIGRKDFEKYLAGKGYAKKWQLGIVSRSKGETTATYSCGDGCEISLYDTTSDGLADESRLHIQGYTVYFGGDLPDPAHEMLQRAVLTAFDHFIPGTFSGMFAGDEWDVEWLNLSEKFDFTLNPFKAEDNAISFEGKPLTFAPDPEAPAVTAEGAPSAPGPAGQPKMMISVEGGELVDVTEQYSDHKPENLGVVPLP